MIGCPATVLEPLPGSAAHYLWKMILSGEYIDTTGPHHSPAIDALQAEFGMSGEPWCAMFAWKGFSDAAEQVNQPCGLIKTASSQEMLAWFRNQGLTSTNQADLRQWGGALAIRTDASGNTGHVTTVLGRELGGEGDVVGIITAEGNTNQDGSSNGEMAAFHTRSVPLQGYAWHFCNTTGIVGGRWWS